MPFRVYISCDFPERRLSDVKVLIAILKAQGCPIDWAPPSDQQDFYPTLEAAIARCDLFMAAVGQGYNSSSWLCHELWLADMLRRSFGRPLLVALSLGGMKLPPAMAAHSEAVHWLASAAEISRFL